MKLPNWIKIVWWLILVGLVTYFLWQRFDSITSGAANATDIVIFIIWIALLAIPLFQEVSIFGVSFKKEIENLKTEFEKQIISLKSVIQSTINIYPPIPPPDSELPSLEERVRPILEQTLRELGVEKPVSITEETRVPDATQFLFSVRYAIENELRRIWNYWEMEMRLWTGQDASQLGRLPRTVLQMVSGLTELKLISPQLFKLIRDVYAICSSAIHGDDISEAKVNFVREVAPELIATLKAIKVSHKQQKEE